MKVSLPDLPNDVLLEIIDRVESKIPILSSCKTFQQFRKYYIHSLATKEITTKETDQLRRCISEYSLYNLSVLRRTGMENVLITLLRSNPCVKQTFSRLQSLEIDSSYLPFVTSSMFPKPLETLQVVVKKNHQSTVNLSNIPAKCITVMNKKLGVATYPDDVFSDRVLTEEDLACVDVIGIYEQVHRIHFIGCLHVLDLAHIQNLHSLILEEGVCVSTKLPSSIKEVNLTNCRITTCECIFKPCKDLERLHLENMYSTSRHIPLECWILWKQSMTYYADIFTLSYTMPYTAILEHIKEFHVSPGNHLFGRRYIEYSLPHSKHLQKVCMERCMIPYSTQSFLSLVQDVSLEDCYIVDE